MTQYNTYIFGIDYVTFISATKEIHGIDDPTQGSLNLEYEIAEKRGGTNNDIRKTAIHSRKGEVVVESGLASLDLVQLLTGGSVTSLATSAASITTGGSGVTTVYGTTTTILTAINSIEITNATSMVSNDYYLKATGLDKITPTRTKDGKVFAQVTLVASTQVAFADGLTINCGASGVDSLTVGEISLVSARAVVNTINQYVDFDSVKPTTLSARLEVDFDGYKTVIDIPNVQPKGTIAALNSAEFSINNMAMPIYNDQTLARLARITRLA